MGVKGLLTQLDQLSDGESVVKEEKIPPNSTLLIDGCGFVFFILQRVSDSHGRDLVALGGSYLDLSDLFRAKLTRLAKLGFGMRFFFDGPTSYLKSAVSKHRRRERLRSSYQHYLLVHGNSAVETKDLPLPILAIEQFQHTLKMLTDEPAFEGLKVIHCDYEADQEMAIVCRDGNLRKASKGKESRYYCCSGDSDFIAMKDCPMILFPALFAAKAEHITNDLVEVSVPVYRRIAVAAALGLTEAQFVELCILMGNDFTREFQRSVFNKWEGMTTSKWPDDFEALLRIVALHPDGTRLFSRATPKLQMAIEYSRAFYELEDLTPFHIMANLTVDRPLDGEPDEPAVFLTETQRQHIADYCRENKKAILKALHAKTNLAEVLFCWFKDIRGRHKRSFGSIDSTHLTQLTEMMEILGKPLQTTGADNEDTMEELRKQLNIKASLYDPVEWKNVVAGNQYQLVMKHLGRAIGDLLAVEAEARGKKLKSIVLVEPLKLFNGKLFHMLMRQQMPAETYLPSPPVPRSPDVSNADITASRTKSITPKQTGSSIKELPIDKHRDAILAKLERDRVVIIHGETGCGKSSRIPVFIYEEAERRGHRCRFMVSQPRRIAATNLKNRLQQTLGTKVGLRLGGGVREETEDTVIHFVTTGYLAKKLANSPNSFAKHTHLIIDEIHERTVDADLLCYLARKLLASNRHLRLILMSANVHAELYQDYFSPHYNDGANYGDLQVLSVGVTPFPLTKVYIEDLVHNAAYQKHSGLRTIVANIVKASDKAEASMNPQVFLDITVKDQLSLAFEICQNVRQGTGVIIFVSGIQEIFEMQQKFKGNAKYFVVPIHKDIPYEEQLEAFKPTRVHEVKVVIATNAAESSITLPDVDTVICFGTHKTLEYDFDASDSESEESDEDSDLDAGFNSLNRAVLIKRWISKSSAIQRAGRTARTRAGGHIHSLSFEFDSASLSGTVYRLYSKRMFENFAPHYQAEVFRTPLHDTLLYLKVIVGRSLFDDPESNLMEPILHEFLEPPDTTNIHRSFEHLFQAQMISAPCDGSDLTKMGTFAGQLSYGLPLSRLIAYGIALGIGAEAVVFACALTLPTPVFRRPTPLVHGPNEYIKIAKEVFLAQVHLDNGQYSEPIMMLKLFKLFHAKEWGSSTDAEDVQKKLAWEFGIVHAKMQQFIQSCKYGLIRVNEALRSVSSRKTKGRENHLSYLNMASGYPDDDVTDNNCGVAFSPELLTHFRLILTWASFDNVVTMAPRIRKTNQDALGLVVKTLKNPALSDWQLLNLFECAATRGRAGIEYNSSPQSSFQGCFRDSGELPDRVSLLQALFVNVRDVTVVGVKHKDDCIWFAVLASTGNDEAMKVDCWRRRFINSLGRVHYCGKQRHKVNWAMFETYVFEVLQPTPDESVQYESFLQTHSVKYASLIVKPNPNIPEFIDAILTITFKPPVGYVPKVFRACAPTLHDADPIFGELSNDEGEQSIRFMDQPCLAPSAEVVAPLFKDCSLGLRLFKAYVSGYLDGLLRISLEDGPSTDQRSDSRWSGKPKPAAIDYGSYELGVKHPTVMNWLVAVYDGQSATGEREFLPYLAVVMPKFSVMAAAYHDEKEVYGVAYDVLELQNASGRRRAVCNGVTLLPVGERFVSLALACVNARLNSVAELGLEDKIRCNSIKDHLDGQTDAAIGVDEVLQRLVREAFHGFF